jgi:hypothetical protein
MAIALGAGNIDDSNGEETVVFVPISRPTDATCDRFLFFIYMCITLHVSCVKRSSSEFPHRTYSLQFLCLCLSTALSCKKSSLQDSSADRHKHRKWRLYVRWGTPDDERLTLKTCGVLHIQIENKNLSQVATVVYLLEYMKMHGPGNIKVVFVFCEKKQTEKQISVWWQKQYSFFLKSIFYLCCLLILWLEVKKRHGY